MMAAQTDYRVREDCRLCGARELEKVCALTPTPPANAFVSESELGVQQACFPLDLHQCRVCHHLQLLTVVNPRILFEKYVYVSGTSPIFVEHFENYAKDIIATYHLSTNDLVLDVGSNDGTLLHFFQKAGCQVLGIDPASDIAREATAQGIETWPCFFDLDIVDKIISEKQLPKVICANNVFAHTDKMLEFTKAVKRLLAFDGVFVFEVSYLVDVYEKTLFDMTYHEHLAYHSVMPLERFFAQLGLALIDVKRVNTHGGSLRGVVQHQNGPYQREASVDQFIAKEKALALDSVETFRHFGDAIRKIGENLRVLLEEIRAAGKTVVGYGAPAKATTLLYHFGIDQTVIDYIVDDNPKKQNLFTPGLHIPVVSSNRLKEVAPDYILILAWNFADSIIHLIKSRYNHDFHFIIPLPTLEIRK